VLTSERGGVTLRAMLTVLRTPAP